ncbi:hypothetical protein ACQPW1_09995 [Nocardia sp. CA-128927]|uniref:hypothetical protein n=1 Tax=Nocardia sp. CA-128927 TaxID=3239975 RepID=UPI003D994673
MAFTAGHIKITVSPDLTNFKDKIEKAVRELEASLNKSAERHAEQVNDAYARGREHGEAFRDGYNDGDERRRAAHDDRADREGERRSRERGARNARAESEARRRELDKAESRPGQRPRRTKDTLAADEQARLARSIANEKARARARAQNSTERILSDARAKERARTLREELREKASSEADTKAAPTRERLRSAAEAAAQRRTQRASRSLEADTNISGAGPLSEYSEAFARQYRNAAREHDKAIAKIKRLHTSLRDAQQSQKQTIDQTAPILDPDSGFSDRAKRGATRRVDAAQRRVDSSQDAYAAAREPLQRARADAKRLHDEFRDSLKYTERVEQERRKLADEAENSRTAAGRTGRARASRLSAAEQDITAAGILTQDGDAAAKRYRNAAKQHDKAIGDIKRLHTAVIRAQKAEQLVEADAAKVLGDRRASSSGRSKARTNLDTSRDRSDTARRAYEAAREPLRRARADVEKLRDEFRDVRKVAPHDEDFYRDLIARQTASMRAQMGNPVELGSKDEHLYQVEREVKQGWNDRRRPVLKSDKDAIRAATLAATTVDRDQQQYKTLLSQRASIEQAVTSAAVARQRVEQAGTGDTAQLTSANERLNRALSNRVDYYRRLNSVENRYEGSRTLYNHARTNLNNQSTRNPLLRGMERINLGVGEKWDALNNKLIFMGRYLSSVGQIATSSAVAMAAFGAVNLMPLISALGQAMASLAAVPAVVTAAGAGIAALVIGSKGIVSAFKAAGQASKTSATDQEDAADKQADAIRQVGTATDNLAVARRDADRTAASGARQVAGAEKTVQTALRNSTDAQKSLTKAREAAAEKIRDLNDALKGTALSERGAKLAALRAEKNLWKTSADPSADWLDIAEAVYNRDEANYNADQATKTNQKAHDDAANASAKGVEGDEQVLAAKEALIDANERLAESQEQVGVIVQQVADSNDDAQRRIRQAVESYDDALRNQQKMLRDLGQSATSKKFQEELDKLAPNAKDFVQQVRSLGPEWTSLRHDAEDALANGVGPLFRDVATKHLPLMRLGFAAINTELNSGLKQSLSVFNTTAAQRDFATFLANTAGGFRGLAQAAAPMSQIFIDLTTAGSAVLPRLGEALAKSTDRFSNRVSAARETGELNLAIDRGIEKMQQFGRVIANTFGGLRGFFQALRGDGDGLLASLDKSTAKFEAWTKSAEGAESIRRVFTAINDKVTQLWGTVTSLVSAFTQLAGPVLDNFGFTLDIAQQLAEAIQSVVSAVMSFGPAATVVEGLLTAFAALYTMKSLSGTFADIKSKVADAFAAIRTGAGNARGHFRDISDSVRGTYDTVSNTERLRPGLSRMQGMVSGAFAGIQTTATKAFTGIARGVNSLVGSMGGWFSVGAVAAIAVVTSVMSSVDETDRKIDDLNKRTEQARQMGIKFKEDLNTQLGASGGAINDEVKGTVLGQYQDYQKRLQDTIDDRSSGWDRTVSRFQTRHQRPDGTYLRTDAEILNDNATAAQTLKDAIAKTGYSETQITNALTGNNAKFEEFRTKLLGIKDGGKEAADEMDRMRKEIIDTASSANSVKTAMEAIADGNRDAADAVKQLSDALARQNKNWLTYEDANKSAADSVRALANLDLNGKGQVDITAEGIIDTKASEAGSRLYDEIKSIKDAYDEQASSAYYSAKQHGKTEEEARAQAKAATADITAAVRARISMYTSEQSAIDNLLNHYGLAADSFEKQATNKQEIPTWLDPNAVKNPVAPPADQPPAENKDGQNPAAPLPILDPKQNPAPQGQVPAPDYAAATKAHNEFIDVVTKLKTALIDAAAALTSLNQGLGDAKGPAEAAKAPVEELGTAITGLKDAFEGLLGENGALKSWGGLLTGIESDISKLNAEILPKLTAALDPVEAAFTSKVAAIGTAFAGIKKAVADPINWLIQSVFDGGLKNAWNSVRAILPSLPEWKGDFTPLSGYQTGGVIPGYTPGVDNQIIAVGGGEGIMRPEFVRAVGPDWVHGMNAAARSGGISAVQQRISGLGERFAGAFQTGGVVPQATGNGPIVDWMKSVITERFPNIQLTSGYRNEPGSYHSTGQAGDFSDGTDDTPGMQKLSSWIASNFLASTLELIHQPFGHNILNRAYVGDGEGAYGSTTMADHRSHVHWALARALGNVTGTAIPGEGWDGNAAATSRIQQLLWQPLATLRQSMPKVGNSAVEQIPNAMFAAVMNQLTTAIGNSQDAGITPFDIAAGAQQWRPNVIAALEREGWAADERNIRLTLAQISSESGGDPNVIQQIQDINSGGNEGVGVLQVIPGTFAAYRNPALPNDRTNVDANISAALRYYRARWGDDLGTMWGQGHGYDQGGWLPHGGWGWNLSGKSEPVFTNEQWQNMVGQLSSLSGAIPGMKTFRIPSGPSEFVDTLTQVVAAAANAIKTLSQAKTGNPKDQKPAPQNNPDTTGAGMSSSGSGKGTEPDPDVLADAKNGLATGELGATQVPTDNPDGDITQTQPDPDSAATGLATGNSGTKTDTPGATTPSDLDQPDPNASPAGSIQPQTTSPTDAAEEAYRTAAMTTRDPQHYKAIWDSALGTDGKGGGFFKNTWNQFTSDLGISGNGFLSQAISAANDPDNQLNQVIKHEWNNSSAAKAMNSGVSGAQTAVQQGISGAQKVVEEHIHYHVTNIDEALRKNAIRQQQNAAAYIKR